MKFSKTFLFTVLSTFALSSLAQDKLQQVAITAIVEHPALDTIRQGIIEELAREGFENGKNISIDFQSAQGSSATAAQIARKFVGDKADLIIPITTPSAQPVVAATRSIPIVFSGVTDPIAAKLVKSWEASGTNVTGISDHKPIAPQFSLIQKLIPNLKSLGYVYSAGEVNSITVLEELQAVAKQQNITIIPVAVQRSADIGSAARSLNGKVQAIYITEDNGVVSAYEALHKAALESRIPVIAADKDTVKRGALAAYAVSQYDIGAQTGKVAARILKGEKAGNIAATSVNKMELSLNQQIADTLNIELPEDLRLEAKEIFNEK